MTLRLYHTDATLLAFTADVTATADGGRTVYLDRTAFYPTSGGQPHDTGMLAGIAVEDVIDEDERIAHRLAAPLPEGVRTVEGVIDAARRRDHMEQHTAQHLLSAVLHDLLGAATVSVHFGAELSTVELDGAPLDAATLAQASARANAVLRENRPVTVSFEDAASAAGLRKASAREGELRIVTIEGLDRSACGGTHVRHTGELGAILLRGQEKIRGHARIAFVAGARATHAAQADFTALARLAERFGVPVADAAARALEEADALVSARAALKAAEERAATLRAALLLQEAEPVGAAAARLVLVRDEATVDAMKRLLSALALHARVVAVGTVPGTPTLAVATSADSGQDAGALVKRVLGELGGRGGGNARLAQGSVADVDAAVERVVAAVRG